MASVREDQAANSVPVKSRVTSASAKTTVYFRCAPHFHKVETSSTIVERAYGMVGAYKAFVGKARKTYIAT